MNDGTKKEKESEIHSFTNIKTAFPNAYLELPGIHPGSLIYSIKGFVFISVS